MWNSSEVTNHNHRGDKMDFPITVNKTQIMYSEINVFLKRGQTKQAIQFIIEKSNCSEKEANDVISDIRTMIKERNQKKEDFSKLKQDISTSNNYKEKCIPKCPTCGSTNIEKISVSKKMKGSFLFGFLSSDVRNTMHCKNCGYKW